LVSGWNYSRRTILVLWGSMRVPKSAIWPLTCNLTAFAKLPGAPVTRTESADKSLIPRTDPSTLSFPRAGLLSESYGVRSIYSLGVWNRPTYNGLPMTNPFSSGGGGTHFEARVAGYYIAAVLCEASGRGLPGDFAKVVQSQRAAFDKPLDDIIIKGVRQDGRETQLDIQIKNKLTFTGNDPEWVDVLKRAWDTFTKDTFDPTLHRIGVGIGTYNARADQHYQSVLTWATYSTDGRDFRERIEKGDYSHKDKQAFVGTVRTVLTAHVGREPTDDEVWRFLGSFVIIHFDFQSGDASRDTAGVVDRLKGLLAPANRGLAAGIWDYLVKKAGELIPAGGGVSRVTLVQQLSRDGFSLGSAPSFWRDIAPLQRESALALGDIKVHIHGLRLHRADPYQSVRQGLEEARFIQIDGEPGSGKSALLKDLAEECSRNGPVLVLKDMRIQPKGWASHAHVLGVSADLPSLLREYACAGSPVLFIDGIDKIVDPAIQLTVNDVLKAIAFDDALSQWRIVVTVREQNLRHLETWLDPDALKKLPLRTVTVEALNDNELDIVARRFPRLRPLLNQSGNADIILRRPFFLDAMLTLAGLEGTERLPATEVELLKLWWDLGASDRADFSLAQHCRNLLLQLAERLATAPNRPISINDLAPERINELKSAGILRDTDLGHSVVFTHDIYEEWALCQLLISRGHDLASFLKNRSEADVFVRPVQLLGTYLLEAKPSVEDWKALYENVGGADLRPVWQRAVLTSSLHSTRATQLLRGVANYLLENNGDHLRKMLMALATTEVLPNPVFLDEKLTPDIEPADRTMLAHYAAVPKAVTWVRFLDWLMPLVPTLPPQLIPDLLPVFATWQNAFAGNRVRHCRQIGQLSYGWLLALEEANRARDYRDVRAPFGGALNGRDIEKSLRALFLSSVGDVPNLGSEYLRKKLADQDRLHIFRGPILSSCGALVRHLPSELVDFFLGAFLERPEHRNNRFGGYSDHLTRELGVAHDHEFYPASPIQLPFLGLLNSNEGEGLRLVRSLCNHSISVWRWACQHRMGRSPVQPIQPIPITLTFPWGQQSFWGDGQVYLWFRGIWGSEAVRSALMALDQWALNSCEKGAPFEEVFRKVIEGNDSVAALGVGVSLCLAYPGKSLECALPLVTCPHLWGWDVSRLVQEMGIHTNEMGDWHRYRLQLKAVQRLNEYPHRRKEIRDLVPYFVCSGDKDLVNRYAVAIRSFPENLPLSYEEEESDEGHLNELHERMALFSEQGDPAHFKAERTEDGRHIKIWNEPPSLKQEKYRVQQQEQEQLNEFASIAIWAQKALDDGVVGEQISIDEAVAKVKQWDRPGVFDSVDAQAFEDEQRAAAIAGAAFVAARYTNDAQGADVLEWCRDVFDRAISATREPSRWSSRGSILSLHPLVFAAHGYAALLAKGQDIAHCQGALLRLAVDPLGGVQSAVFAAARQFAGARPEFYWLLLDVALRQCVVADEQIPNYHLIVFDAKEAEFKEKLRARAESLAASGTIPDLPTIPLAWIKSAGPQRRAHRDTKGYARNKTIFLHNVAGKVLFQAPLEPILADATMRVKFLKTLGELLEWTLQEIIPPFADRRHDHRGNTPFEWVFGFAAWCGRVCAYLTPAEARQAVLDRIFSRGTNTALMIMQCVTKSFMVQAFLRAKDVTTDKLTLWHDITDWIFASREWHPDSEHLDREFVTCAFAVLFCVAPDFSPLLCGVEPGWPHLAKFNPILERAVREFGRHRTLYLGVTTFLKNGGFDLLPRPALAWLEQIAREKKADQEFWNANGDDTVELLGRLIKQKGAELSLDDSKTIILISDLMTDNGVRGAAFLQQELLRGEKDKF